MPNESWSWTAEERLPSRLGASEDFIQRLLDALVQCRWNEHDVFGIRLAMEEALVNAIRHGNELNSKKQVRVTCKLSASKFWAMISDEGSGFDPKQIPDPTARENLERPSGRGVMLIRSFMSRVEYNEVGNCVVMEKDREE